MPTIAWTQRGNEEVIACYISFTSKMNSSTTSLLSCKENLGLFLFYGTFILIEKDRALIKTSGSNKKEDQMQV